MRKILIEMKVLNGNPHLEGTRLSVFDVVSDLNHEGLDDFLEIHSEINKEDISNVLEYCKNRKCDEDENHCGGCVLRTKQDGITSMDEFIDRFSEVKFSESDEVLIGNGLGTMLMPGNKNNLQNTWRGEEGWKIAEKLITDLG